MLKLDASKCRYVTEEGRQCQNPPKQGSYLCDTHIWHAGWDREVFHGINDRFMQDIREFFTRSNFYLVAETALLSVFFTKFAKSPTTTPSDFIFVTIFALAGLVLAFLWWLTARGAIFWIRWWSEELQRLDDSLDRFRSYSRMADEAKRQQCKSPQQITQWLPILFGLIWIVTLLIVIQDWVRVAC